MLARHRCVPQIASPEARKVECTTAPQSHASASPGAEPNAGRMYYGATVTHSLVQGEQGGGEEERRRGEGDAGVKYNKQNLTQGVRKKKTNYLIC